MLSNGGEGAALQYKTYKCIKKTAKPRETCRDHLWQHCMKRSIKRITT